MRSPRRLGLTDRCKVGARLGHGHVRLDAKLVLVFPRQHWHQLQVETPAPKEDGHPIRFDIQTRVNDAGWASSSFGTPLDTLNLPMLDVSVFDSGLCTANPGRNTRAVRQWCSTSTAQSLRTSRLFHISHTPRTGQLKTPENLPRFLVTLLVLQRRFLNLPSSWSEIAPREERPQGWQAREQVAMEMCSRSFHCEPSL